MSTTDLRNQSTVNGRITPPPIPPNYGATVPTTSNYGSTVPTKSTSDMQSTRPTRCVTGVGFLTTIQGILNIVIIITLICVLISACAADGDNCKQADNSNFPSKSKVSAYDTRSAVITFAIIGLILIIVDTILHTTGYIERIPPSFDFIFIVIMIILGVVYLVLGCCAAAWEQKMNDTVRREGRYKRQGAAAAASFFLFITMIAVLVNFVLRLMRPTPRSL